MIQASVRRLSSGTSPWKTGRDQAARARRGRFLRYSRKNARKIPTKRLVTPAMARLRRSRGFE
jgi:hypothetical protein